MKDTRNLLHVLQTELEFLQNGGYRHVARAPWRAARYFEDSPTCPRLARLNDEGRPCAGCVLWPLVPAFAYSDARPCRHIRLNDEGMTLEILYHCGTPQEIRTAFEEWLKRTIGRLEMEQVFVSPLIAS